MSRKTLLRSGMAHDNIWLIKELLGVVEAAIERGHLKYDSVKFNLLMNELATDDFKLAPKERVGFWKFRLLNPFKVGNALKKIEILFNERLSRMLPDDVPELPKVEVVKTLNPHPSPASCVSVEEVQVENSKIVELNTPKIVVCVTFAEEYRDSVLREYIQRVFDQHQDGKITVLDLRKLGSLTYDFLISYENLLADVTDFLRSLSWVVSVKTKPLNLFGFQLEKS